MKPPPKLYKIGEVIRYSDFSRQTIHNYTKMGLIEPEDRTEAGHRLYGPDVFERLEKIKMLKRHRTLEEVKEILENGDGDVISTAAESGEEDDSGNQ